MVRNYKKVPGTRNYKNYSEETLEEALQKITDGVMSINAASIAYKIPFGTLYNRYKGLYGRPAGGQTTFTFEEEKALLKAAATCADWGFPLTTFDLRMIAKSYLDRQGKTVKKFANNLPGIDWAMSVLKRHKDEYGQKVASNIKRARAQVDRETLIKYFDHLEKEVEGVPARNIFNYDESNLSDDPGKKRCIYRKGVKYPERVMNHSKSCTTIMVCGSADGTLLPPYVIYKSLHLYDTWKERGVMGEPCCGGSCCSRGSRYNRTQSGWIDGPTFRDWFATSFLPHANRLEGRKVIIGDNLSSHLDTGVLNMCEQHNISFVCLVPNSTHICQPLDVGFFRPMKIAWRKIIEEWKQTHLNSGTIPKESFPNLLKQALVKMDQVAEKKPSTPPEPSAIKRNLKSSFRATGICPWDKEQVLKKIPGNDETEANAEAPVRDVLTEYLKERRFSNAPAQQPARKKTRLQVEPGKSISAMEEEELNEIENEPALLELYGDDPETMDAHAGPSQSTHENDPDGHAESDIDSDVTRCEGPEIGAFVLAKFSSAKGKKMYRYVCVIEDVSEGKIVVKGLKSYRNNKRAYGIVDDDVSIIEETDIEMFLPMPKFEDSCYVFPTIINVKEL